MMRLFTFLVMILSFSVSTSAVGQDEIGLYFDEGGTINCLPDLTGFPQTKEVFLILKDCSSSSGVGGWEGAISLPVGCYMTDFDLGPDALNVATIPEFVVGLGTPMTQSPLMVLARFTLLFTAPGEVFLFAPEQNSIDGVFAPVYVEGGSQGDLVEMDYSFGDPFNVVLTAGLASCPPDTIYQDSNSLGDPDFEVLFPNEELTIQTGHADSGIVYPTFASKINHNSTHQIGLKGIVDDIYTENISTEYHSGGVSKLTININEIFWGGIETPLFEVWVKGTPIPGKIDYCKQLRFPLAGELVAGDEVVVFCNQMEDGAFWANRYSCFPTSSSKSCPAMTETDYGILKRYERKFSLRNQLKKADFVATLEHGSTSNDEFFVKTVYIGDKTLVGKTVNIDNANGWPGRKAIEQAFGYAKNPTGKIFVLLERSPEGKLFLLNGRKSFFIQTDRGWVANGRTPDRTLSITGLKYKSEVE